MNSSSRNNSLASPSTSSRHNSRMGPTLSMRETPSFVRPSTRDRPASARANSLIEDNDVPSRTSSLHSRITQPSTTATTNAARAGNTKTPKTLTHAYMVCGVGREPAQWVKAPSPSQGKIGHMKGAVGQFWMPEILGSSPRLEQDNEIARLLHSAMKACFPHDVEICTGKTQPPCVHHSFVLQQDSAHTIYGIALRVWSRADDKRAETIRDLRRRTEFDFFDNPSETYWIPYCLSFLSRYPLYDLLGDYLRGMWIHWNKATNLFHAEEVSRILSFPAPRLNDLVRIDMKDYALCYQFPSSPTGFQNFSMWPLFTCLSIPNIVGVVEAAISPTRRIIFTSHYPAMLTVAAETVRYFVRVYEWSGLYVPIVHARHVTELVQEPGPYILGITSECRSLFNPPSDALVVDLDRNFVLTSSPPSVLSARQRQKMVHRLTQALNGDVTTSGVPNHLRSAYGGGKLIPAGQIIVMKGEVESVQDPEWWNQDNVMTVMDHVCEKLGRNTGLRAVFGGANKKPLMTKVSMRHLNEIVRERNQYSRDTAEAWQDYINLKSRLDQEIGKVNKRNNFLVEELESWKQQFLKFQAFAESLTKETQDLKVKIEGHKRENKRLTALIDSHKDEIARLSVRLSGTEKQRDDALEALVLQQEIAEELERERKRNKKELANLQQTNKNVIRQREEAQRVVVHLRSLISGQTHHMEHLVRSMHSGPEPAAAAAAAAATNSAEDYDDESPEDKDDDGKSTLAEDDNSNGSGRIKLASSRSVTQLRRLSRRSRNSVDAASGNYPSPSPRNKRFSESSFVDVADRHLRDKTDAIAHIIRSISDQCAAAVEGLQLAHNAEQDAEARHRAAAAADSLAASTASLQDHDDATVAEPSPSSTRNYKRTSLSLRSQRPSSRLSLSSLRAGASNRMADDAASETRSNAGTIVDDARSDPGAPSSARSAHNSVVSLGSGSVPPTPDLVHRASTALSLASSSAATERASLGGASGYAGSTHPRIAEDDESVEGGGNGSIVSGSGAGSVSNAGGKGRRRISGMRPNLVVGNRIVGGR